MGKGITCNDSIERRYPTLKYLGNMSQYLKGMKECVFLKPEIDDINKASERFCVIKNGELIFKFHDLSEGEDTFGRIERYNKFFGKKTGYTILGWVRYIPNEFGLDVIPVVCAKEKDLLVISQRYFDLDWSNGYYARMKLMTNLLFKFSEVRIYGERYESDWIIKPNGDGEKWVFLDDLKDANLGIDKMSGECIVVDCFVNNEFYKGNEKAWGAASKRFSMENGFVIGRDVKGNVILMHKLENVRAT